MFDCQGCPHKAHDGSCTYGVGCPYYGNPHFKPSRPETVKPLKKAGMTENRMTNADRIRAMSDEELAELLGMNSLCEHIQYAHPEWCEKQGVCDTCLTDWLKRPAEG